ncbi:MAG: hypothetical protein H0V19_05770, partial [Euzebyales bacterium]|nr:hypothetical protein [Euzebyales bacterium]
ERINGEPAQVVTFYSPATQRQSEAWFAWWVGTETGTVYRIAMVARLHYMVEEFRDLNTPFEITPPVATGEHSGVQAKGRRARAEGRESA